MKYKKLGKSGIKVSEIGFGAWQLGNEKSWSAMTDKEAIKLVHTALDLGVNFFDTAPNYGMGSSERLLGAAFNNTSRDKVVINTKFGHTESGETNYNSNF
ncbi:MAG: aldo/keto reductase, partial [Candidatus Nitrosopelagicus sp.]|nr:aldo/keto reductase [Candidatus Nitrosopelagicus sp.]